MAVLALVGVSGGAALAVAPYTVHVTAAPRTVKKSSRFTVHARGNSSNLSRLTVWLSPHGCAPTSAREHRVHPKAVEIINHNVVGMYARSKTLTAKVVGSRVVCGYLTGPPPQSLPRAAGAAPLTVTP